MLGPSIDMRDECEDEIVMVEGVPFIASDTIITEYGPDFELVMVEGKLQVNALARKAETLSSCSIGQ